MTASSTNVGVRAVPSPTRRRLTAGMGASLVIAVDLSAKAWAVSALQDRVVGLGPVDLRLAYNPGVAFSVAAGAPAWLVVTLTAVIAAAVGVVAWRAATGAPRGQLAALALILGGAIAIVVDRAGDGVVTDYLHTGWWPTFNLADTAIVAGAALMVLTTLRHPTTSPSSEDGAVTRDSGLGPGGAIGGHG